MADTSLGRLLCFVEWGLHLNVAPFVRFSLAISTLQHLGAALPSTKIQQQVLEVSTGLQTSTYIANAVTALCLS